MDSPSFDEWTCPVCGYRNRHKLSEEHICEHCGTPKPRELPEEDPNDPTPGYY